MESSGECRGCQRNIKFAVKQARLCRTCYNKTYLTSQKRREYYKNKKKRRETSSSVEPAIDVHQHRHHSKSIKKEDSQGNRSPPRTLPYNSGQVPTISPFPENFRSIFFVFFCPRAESLAFTLFTSSSDWLFL